MRIAHVIAPRADATRPVLEYAWDAVIALSRLTEHEVEAIAPVPLALFRKKRWPAELDEKLRALEPHPTLISYPPLPRRSIEAASAAIALHLLKRPHSKRPHLIQGSLLDEAGFMAVDAARVLGCRSIAVAHGSDVRAAKGELGEGRKRRALHALEHATTVVAVSNYLAQELAKLGRRAELVRYTTFADRFPLAREAPRPNEVLFVGRISRDKGADVLVHAASELPGLNVRFAGRMVDVDPRAVAKELGVEDRVHVEGERSQDALAALYAKASATVLPSLHEGFGIVLVESLLVGRPVIGSAVGGIRDIVTADVGALAAAGDPRALAQAITNVLARRFDPHALRNAALPMTWEANARVLGALAS